MTISPTTTGTDPNSQSEHTDETIKDRSPETAPRQSAVRSLRRLVPYARPALPALIGSALTAMVAMLCGLVFPLVIQQIIDGPIAAGDLQALWPYAGLLLLLGIFEAALFWVRRMLASRPTMRVEAAMRAAIYDHLQKLPVAFHDRWSAGQLMSRAVSDLVTIRRFLAFGLVFLFVNITTFVVGVVILLVLSWQLGLVIAALAIPLVALSFVYELKYQLLARRSQDQVGDLATMVEESVLGIRILKAFGRSGHLTKRFLAEAADLKTTEMAKARVISKLWAVIIAVPELAFGLTLFLGIRQVATGELSAGALVAFFGVALGLRWPIDSIGWLLAMSNDAATATQRFYEVMDAPITVTSPVEPVQAADRASGRLRFSGVRFGFADATQGSAELLRGVDLDIAPGQTVALVGATGSGKTTLTSLVNRLYDVTGGSITLDGVDIRQLDLDYLRSQIAVAFEEPTLFSASVRENVLLGRPAGSDDDVRQALRVAQADFVLDLPWGLDTRIGEQGLSLSGGQRQRLALARAVVGRPPVLVLDDPLSALDIHTESQVEQALRSVLAGTTALVVAHRASTVLLADRVALLVDGRIAAIGTHSELMATEPRYQDLLASRDDVSSAAGAATGPGWHTDRWSGPAGPSLAPSAQPGEVTA
jgi:ATP-binding cassette subfamily B protein